MSEDSFDRPESPPPGYEEERLRRSLEPAHRQGPDYFRARLNIPGSLRGSASRLSDHLAFWSPSGNEEKDKARFEVAINTSQSLTGDEEEKQKTLADFSTTISSAAGFEETLEVAKRVAEMVEEAIPDLPDNQRLYDNPTKSRTADEQETRSLILAGIMHNVPSAMPRSREEEVRLQRRKGMDNEMKTKTSGPVLVHAYEIASRIAGEFPNKTIVEDVVTQQFDQ